MCLTDWLTDAGSWCVVFLCAFWRGLLVFYWRFFHLCVPRFNIGPQPFFSHVTVTGVDSTAVLTWQNTSTSVLPSMCPLLLWASGDVCYPVSLAGDTPFIYVKPSSSEPLSLVWPHPSLTSLSQVSSDSPWRLPSILMKCISRNFSVSFLVVSDWSMFFLKGLYAFECLPCALLPSC